ncbi:MAG TPA: hypothetical protein VF981_11130 [Gemmatimonadaceae bacterium]
MRRSLPSLSFTRSEFQDGHQLHAETSSHNAEVPSADGVTIRYAGLFIQVDRGFCDPDQVLLATVDFDLAGIHDNPGRQQLVDRLVGDLAAIPGVQDAAVATLVPLGFLDYRQVDTEV